MYEPLIYDDILRLSSTMPEKCTFTFSMKENWFLRFFAMEANSISEMLYVSKFYKSRMMHGIKLW